MPIVEFLSQLPFAGKAIDYLFLERGRRLANQEKHFADIKSRVLQPLSEQISEYYSRACFQHAPLMMLGQLDTTDNPESLTESVRTNYRYRLEPCDPKYQLYAQQPLVHSPYAQGVDRPLYEDCKLRHYPQIVHDWESFKNEFDDVIRKVIELAEIEAKRLSDRSSLPQSQASDRYGMESANYLRLGMFIIDRLMERSYYALIAEPVSYENKFKLRIDSQDVALSADKALIDRLVIEIDNGYKINRPAADALNQGLKDLGESIAPFLESIGHELRSHKKMEDCEYVG